MLHLQVGRSLQEIEGLTAAISCLGLGWFESMMNIESDQPKYIRILDVIVINIVYEKA